MCLSQYLPARDPGNEQEQQQVEAMQVARPSEQLNRLLTHVFRPENSIRFARIVLGRLIAVRMAFAAAHQGNDYWEWSEKRRIAS